MAKGRKTGGIKAITNEERFWKHVDKNGPAPACRPDLGPCWLWTAHLNEYGYGVFGVRPMDEVNPRRYRIVGAHKFAYEMQNGPIEKGLTVDHLCRVRRCVRNSHFEKVTNRVNVLRGIGPSAIAARRTHCVNGHEFTVDNTYRRKYTEGRKCRLCMQIRMEKRHASRST